MRGALVHSYIVHYHILCCSLCLASVFLPLFVFSKAVIGHPRITYIEVAWLSVNINFSLTIRVLDSREILTSIFLIVLPSCLLSTPFRFMTLGRRGTGRVQFKVHLLKVERMQGFRVKEQTPAANAVLVISYHVIK